MNDNDLCTTDARRGDGAEFEIDVRAASIRVVVQSRARRDCVVAEKHGVECGRAIVEEAETGREEIDDLEIAQRAGRHGDREAEAHDFADREQVPRRGGERGRDDALCQRGGEEFAEIVSGPDRAGNDRHGHDRVVRRERAALRPDRLGAVPGPTAGRSRVSGK